MQLVRRGEPAAKREHGSVSGPARCSERRMFPPLGWLGPASARLKAAAGSHRSPKEGATMQALSRFQHAVSCGLTSDPMLQNGRLAVIASAEAAAAPTTAGTPVAGGPADGRENAAANGAQRHNWDSRATRSRSRRRRPAGAGAALQGDGLGADGRDVGTLARRHLAAVELLRLARVGARQEVAVELELLGRRLQHGAHHDPLDALRVGRRGERARVAEDLAVQQRVELVAASNLAQRHVVVLVGLQRRDLAPELGQEGALLALREEDAHHGQRAVLGLVHQVQLHGAGLAVHRMLACS
ncbi:hypothetical protein ON010_g12644 [Phytophthora cinnamomi]|nr:hypothetical protein ON010_g12644 [Phytophthora cinnamomi]